MGFSRRIVRIGCSGVPTREEAHNISMTVALEQTAPRLEPRSWTVRKFRSPALWTNDCSSSRPKIHGQARRPQLVKAATTAAIPSLRFRNATVNNSERQCTSTSIDCRSVPRGRPGDRSSSRGGQVPLRCSKAWASVFLGVSRQLWRSKTLDEVRALRRIAAGIVLGRSRTAEYFTASGRPAPNP